MASGGTERSRSAMEARLNDAVEKAGGNYLDLFLLEYVCPNELVEGEEVLDCNVLNAIQQAQEWKNNGLIRCVGALTHSHRVVQMLANTDGIDTVMLRYSMSHKDAAERLSFPAYIRNKTSRFWHSLTWSGTTMRQPLDSAYPLP